MEMDKNTPIFTKLSSHQRWAEITLREEEILETQLN